MAHLEQSLVCIWNCWAILGLNLHATLANGQGGLHTRKASCRFHLWLPFWFKIFQQNGNIATYCNPLYNCCAKFLTLWLLILIDVQLTVILIHRIDWHGETLLLKQSRLCIDNRVSTSGLVKLFHWWRAIFCTDRWSLLAASEHVCLILCFCPGLSSKSVGVRGLKPAASLRT